jgi:predicted P-loop ATPase
MSPNISIFSSVKQTKTDKTIPIDIFLDNIRDGRWQDIVLPIRTITDKEERARAKQKAPCVTMSGIFVSREDKGLTKASGYIAIDVDDVEDTHQLKSSLAIDPYVAAAFVSISGRGLCILFKIVPARHREAFQGISEYLYNTYHIIADPTSINISRLRFVSYDPHIFINLDNSEKFTAYPKSKPPKKIDKALYTKDDFSEILDQVVARRLNLCENYHEWLRMAFAFVHHFGEAGREYFHIVSQYSSKYDPAVVDKQYTACLKHKGANQATIATFYYYAKAAGVRVYSERTRKIAYSASNGKKAGLSAEQVATNLEKFEEISDSLELVKQVMENDIEVKGEDSLLDQVELWIRQNYDLRLNGITKKVENHGVALDQKDLNGIYWRAKKVFDRLTFELIDRYINSDFIDEFNPLLDFIEANKHMESSGNIEALFASIECKDKDFLQHFGRKWLVSLMASIHGEHSPLMLVLVGEIQGTGKTEFFRRLLPKEIREHYYAESKLDAGKDDEILMTQKILIMDDEMGGKSKKESKRLKELTSKQVFSLRAPYGKHNIDLKRLAVLCGTTNDNEILNDPTGNRRIIPVEVTSINHSSYNKVDKTALFMEVFRLWSSGFEWKLSRHDIDYLNKDAADFEVTSLEGELLGKFFEPGLGQFGIEYLTASDIKVIIENITHQKLNPNKLSQELKKQGFANPLKKVKGRTGRHYVVKRIVDESHAVLVPDEQLPF